MLERVGEIMAKISPVSIKYMIYASFIAKGALEKPDVIGAIFGQTEGLLGEDLEMRELQKEGKIGRIEVEMEIVDGKSVGEIKIPTAMDRSETTLIAAALETIDRIGPTEAKIEVTKIEDVRGSKREYILERAKKLMSSIEESGNFKEMSETLKGDSRIEKIQEYGENKLPCGDISRDELIVVEGRADVVNLLRNRVNNVIGMDGTKLPPEIRKLSEEKEITLFVDGDRGGKLIAKNVIENANVKYVAMAPEGKEVEELTGKEILQALRRRVTVREFLSQADNGTKGAEGKTAPRLPKEEMKEKLRKIYEGKLKDGRGALLLDSGFDVIKKVGTREVIKNLLTSRKEVFAVIVEGTATSSLVKVCEEKNVSYLAATNFGNSVEEAQNIELVSL